MFVPPFHELFGSGGQPACDTLDAGRAVTHGQLASVVCAEPVWLIRRKPSASTARGSAIAVAVESNFT
jgi:hypothetical protein